MGVIRGAGFGDLRLGLVCEIGRRLNLRMVLNRDFLGFLQRQALR